MTSNLDLDDLLTSGIPDGLSTLRPASAADYRNVEQELRRQRAAWVGHLRAARREMKLVLEHAGLRELRGGERGESVDGRPLPPGSYLLLSRLKSPEAILRKMARFGEELCCMLDIWGIRLVVPGIDSLDVVARLAQAHWANVPERQLMLRGGQMRFAPVRDYRAKEHVGRSGATSLNYDEAVHVNRRAPFGVVEIQVSGARLGGLCSVGELLAPNLAEPHAASGLKVRGREMLRTMDRSRRAASSFSGSPSEAEGKAAGPPAARAAKGKGVRRATSKATPRPVAHEPAPEPAPFTRALADLLRSRNLDVPDGLLEAPPQAYAGQGAEAVQTLAGLKDADLEERASRVAQWDRRQAERAERAWESSPLIRELRRRGLHEPDRPARSVGVAFSLKKPLAEWTDGEVADAAAEWARLGGGTERR